MRVRTYELTNFCPHDCPYCSSNAVNTTAAASFLDALFIRHDLEAHGPFDTIVLSGGEPLAHPDFYDILTLCKGHAKSVLVYTNALSHIVFNANVIDGVRVDANLPLAPNVHTLNVLKRVPHGREATRPEVRLSANYDHDGSQCDPPCDHVVVRPDGSHAKPCDKPETVEELRQRLEDRRSVSSEEVQRLLEQGKQVLDEE
jgi:organic radical activating enzyme